MGSRDYRHRELKKPKKAAKKPVEVSLLSAPPPVEMVSKRRKEREEPSEA